MNGRLVRAGSGEPRARRVRGRGPGRPGTRPIATLLTGPLLTCALLVVLVGVMLSVTVSRTTARAAARPAAAPAAAACRVPAVAVVVDFGHWGGSAHRGCVAFSAGLTGLGALERAGFAVTGTANYGTAFVCRIDGYPRPAADRCLDTPPASAYWSYWHADQGQATWSYGTVGASQYRPAAGSVDAWTFGGTDAAGAGGRPAFSPAQVRPESGPATSPPRSSAPASTATATRTPPPTRSGTGYSAPPEPGSNQPTAPRQTTPRSAPPRAPTSTSGLGTTPPRTGPVPTIDRPPALTGSAPATTAGAPDRSGQPTRSGASPPASGRATERIVDNPAAGRAAAAGVGSPWPTVAGIGVCALLAAGAGTVAVRRRGTRR